MGVERIDQAAIDQLASWVALLAQMHAQSFQDAMARDDKTEALHHWRVLCEMAQAGGMRVRAYESPHDRVVVAR